MEEMGIEDVDDITAHSKHSGLNPEMISAIMAAAMKAGSQISADQLVEAVADLRKDIRSERTAAVQTRKEREKEAEATT